MPGDFYSDVDRLAQALVEGGQAGLGHEIRLAVEAGSTGSEILMRLRHVFQVALRERPLPDDERSRMTALLEDIDRAL